MVLSESVESALVELGMPGEQTCESLGAHLRFIESYGLVRRARMGEIQLEPVASGQKLQLTATTLDFMSRCSFLGLLYGRWKLSEKEEADWELWPRVRGALLHRAAEKIVLAVQEKPDLPGADELANEVWGNVWLEALQTENIPGWIHSPQLSVQVRRTAVSILKTFIAKELEYRSRSGIRSVAMEKNARLEMSWIDRNQREITVGGFADRIDEHSEGLFVLDYKTSVQGVTGKVMREKGYRLQLPFYAVAARASFKKPVLGVQFVELNSEGKRSVGLFPRRLNGKTPGKLTQLGATNGGLFDEDPDVIWSELQEKMMSIIEYYADSRYSVNPVLGTKECENCRAALICGQLRREWINGEQGSP